MHRATSSRSNSSNDRVRSRQSRVSHSGSRKPLRKLHIKRNVSAFCQSMRHMALDARLQKYYSQSLALPTTEYPLRPQGGSVAMEASVRPAISQSLYTQQLSPTRPRLPGEHPDVTAFRTKTQEKDGEGRRLLYRLHDGPPFANGSLHLGHFYNKTLKDVANRYKLSRGFRVLFNPGWDCHGLPIELKAVEAQLKKTKPVKSQTAASNKTKHHHDSHNIPSHDDSDTSSSSSSSSSSPTTPQPDSIDLVQASTSASETAQLEHRHHVPPEYILPNGETAWGVHTPAQYHPQHIPLERRQLAASFAQAAIKGQKQNMQSWSLLADYNNPYITMDPTFEASETVVLGNLIEKKCLYRQLMPVHWSPSSKTALAESELEYKDITSTALYVCMPIATHNGIFKTSAQPFVSTNANTLAINPAGLSFLIWTTTPWTIPANRSICVSPEGQYAHVKTSITTTVVLHGGQVYDLIEEKNTVLIQSQIETLSNTWKVQSGYTPQQLAHFIPDPNAEAVAAAAAEAAGENPPVSSPKPILPPGLRIIPRGVYDPEKYGTQAVITKGKKKGSIQDMILGRTVDTEIIQQDIPGTELASCEYINPLVTQLRNYILSDSPKTVQIDPTTGHVVRLHETIESATHTANMTNNDDITTLPKHFFPVHKVIPADHVLADQGSGCVHTAPAHGVEDFQVGMQHDIPVACPVDEAGQYTTDVGPEFAGLNALEQGSSFVCKLLQRNGAMLHREDYDHRYPHDWRTLKPVMLRATSQWFCRLDEAKETAKTALEDTFVTNDGARARLVSFINSRDKWCISRQRYWGLPIPVFFPVEPTSSGTSSVDNTPVLCGRDISLYVANLYSVLGTQAWWSLPSWRLMPEQHRGQINPIYQDTSLETIVSTYLKQNNLEPYNVSSALIRSDVNRVDFNSDDFFGQFFRHNGTIITHIDGEAIVGLPGDYYQCPWKIGQDTVDVWLDSGSSWFSALFGKTRALLTETQHGQSKASELPSSVLDHHHHSHHNQSESNDQSDDSNNTNPYDTIFKQLQHIPRKKYNEIIPQQLPDPQVDDVSWQADLYLEGSDQHRGWFQSSLLLSSLMTGHSPFKALHSHGFVVDEKGAKMSKSLGNGLEPDAVILEQGHGVDVLRAWAASVDSSRDAMMGTIPMQNAIDFVRKWRGVMRFALGCLLIGQPALTPKTQLITELQSSNQDVSSTTTTTTPTTTSSSSSSPNVSFNPVTDSVQYQDLHVLDKFILHHLSQTLKECEYGYETYQIHRVIASLRHFMTQPLSSIYFDLSKDRLYANASTDIDRRSALTALYHVFSSLIKVMAPIMPHLAQELFSYIPQSLQHAIMQPLQHDTSQQQNNNNNNNNIDESVVMNAGWVEISPEWTNPDIIAQFESTMQIRSTINQCIELFRQQQTPKNTSKNTKKNNKQQQQQQHDDATTTALPTQQQHIHGDVSSLPKIGSSNEVDVNIVLYTSNTSNTTLNNDVTSQKTPIDTAMELLSNINNSKLHELFMVASTSIHIDTQGVPLRHTTTQVQASDDMTSNKQQQQQHFVIHPSHRFAQHHHHDHDHHDDHKHDDMAATTSNPSIESTVNLTLPNGQEILASVIVSKSQGSKCPRCWRFAISPDTMMQKKAAQDFAYNSFILTSKPSHDLSQQNNVLGEEDAPLCQRCDDFFESLEPAAI